MARLKKGSRPLNKAAIRLASLKSIDPALNLGNGLDVMMYETAINNLQARLQEYNTTLSLIDEQLNLVQEQERLLMDLTERMLTGVAHKYGNDSIEYEKAGGTRKSKWKRKNRKRLRMISRNNVVQADDLMAPLPASVMLTSTA